MYVVEFGSNTVSVIQPTVLIPVVDEEAVQAVYSSK